MASLLQRLVFDKELVSNDYGVAEPVPLPKSVFLEGGGVEEGDDAGEDSGVNPVIKNIGYGQRMSVYFLLVFASLFIALVVFKTNAIQTAVFKKKVDDIGKEVEDDPKKKVKLWIHVLLFIAIFLGVFLGLWLIGAFIYVFFGVLSEDEPFNVAKQVWKHIFISFNEIPIGMNFWLVLFLIILVLAVHYLGYSMFFKGWYEDMYFQDSGNKKKKQDTQIESFIHYYALTILVLFTFFMILLCMKTMVQKGESKLYAYYTMFFFLIYLALAVYVLKKYKQGDYVKISFVAILVFLVVVMYSLLITLIVSVIVSTSGKKGPSPLKGMFKKGMFSNIILRWGIDVSSVIPSKKKGAKAPVNSSSE